MHLYMDVCNICTTRQTIRISTQFTSPSHVLRGSQQVNRPKTSSGILMPMNENLIFSFVPLKFFSFQLRLSSLVLRIQQTIFPGTTAILHYVPLSRSLRRRSLARAIISKRAACKRPVDREYPLKQISIGASTVQLH